MKRLFLISFVVFTTISLTTSCGENTSTGNTTQNSTSEVSDSTSTTTVKSVDSVVVK
jgi:hypothetical protein